MKAKDTIGRWTRRGDDTYYFILELHPSRSGEYLPKAIEAWTKGGIGMYMHVANGSTIWNQEYGLDVLKPVEYSGLKSMLSQEAVKRLFKGLVR